MSTKLHIKNFQSIEDIEFEVDGFTVIVGKNNIGKSAIIRAVNSALTNKSGKSFIRKGKKQTEVTIQHAGTTIDWKKGEKTSYKIEWKEGNEVKKEDFSALGASGIPKPMTDAGFGKMEIGDREVSPLVATQFNELFLLDKIGSVVTQVLSNLYNIDILSGADGLCQKELKANKSSLKTREEDLSSLQERLERFKDFEEIKERVKQLAINEKNCNSLQQEISQLATYESQLAIIQASIDLLSAIDDITIPGTSECEEAEKELCWIKSKETDLRSIAETVKKLRGVKSISIPEISIAEKLIQEVPEIIIWDDKLSEISKKIKKLEPIEDILTVPPIGMIGVLIEELSQIVDWDNKFTGPSKNLGAQDSLLKSLDMENLTELSKKAETLSTEVTEVSKLYTQFFESASQTKIARDDLKKVTEDLNQAQFEKSQIKVCPVCERPF